jgi:hypothetical protein
LSVQFKPGDKVICIRKSRYADCIGEVGEIYTIDSAFGLGGITLVEQNGVGVGLDDKRFKLYTEELYNKLNSKIKFEKQMSEQKKKMKEQLDTLKEKIYRLQKIYDNMV